MQYSYIQTCGVSTFFHARKLKFHNTWKCLPYRGVIKFNGMDFPEFIGLPEIFNSMEIYNNYGKLKSILLPIKVHRIFILWTFTTKDLFI